MLKNYLTNEARRMQQALSEFKKLRSITGGGVLAALNVIIGGAFSISKTLRISFGFLMIGTSAMLYGPFVTGMLGVVADILKFFLLPQTGPYFPWFTVGAFISGFIQGMVLYRKPVTLARTFMARLLVVLINNLFLNPLFLSMLYGNAFVLLLGERIIKNLVMLPVETALLLILLKQVSRFRLTAQPEKRIS